MDTAAVEQLLDEMLTSFEDLETKASAILQFLKDKGNATDKDLAPYLEQAGKASNVRWRAARLRMMSLLSSALKNIELPERRSEAPPPSQKTAEPKQASNVQQPEKTAQEIPAELAQATAPAKTSAEKPPAVRSTKESGAKADEARSTEQKSSGEAASQLADAKLVPSGAERTRQEQKHNASQPPAPSDTSKAEEDAA
jgi:hypothetical protein